MSVPEDDEVAAAEYAFGLPDNENLSRTERRIGTDPAFRTLVDRWQERVVTLFAGCDAAPPSSLWPRIAARLAANDDAAATDILAASVRRWRIVSAVASAAALVLGVVALRPATPPPPAPVVQPANRPPLVAMLSTEQGKPELAVSLDDRGRLTTTPTALVIGDHAAELWVIPADGSPRSLGVVPTERPTWRAVPTEARSVIDPGATLAISVEPLGGSPTGQPTGAVILTGKVTAI